MHLKILLVLGAVLFMVGLSMKASSTPLLTIREVSAPYAKGDLSLDGAIYLPEPDLNLYVIRKVKTNEQFMIVKTKDGDIEVVKY